MSTAKFAPTVAAPDRPPGDISLGMINLIGALKLSMMAVQREMGTSEELVAAEGTLQLALAEAERIYAMSEWDSMYGRGRREVVHA